MILVILKMTVIEQNSDRVAVSNMASTLKDLIDGKCHAETSLEKFIFRKVSWYSKKAQTSDDDISWLWFETFRNLSNLSRQPKWSRGLELLNRMSK